MDLPPHVAGVLHEIRARAGGAQRMVFVSGNFNIVHPGHLRLLRFAADCGDFLVVAVNNNSSQAITVPAEMRLEGVRAISMVGYAFLLSEPPETFIGWLRPAVVVKGKEYETRFNAEKAVLEQYGGKLLFGSGEVRFSSIDLLQREYFEANYSTIRKPTEYPARHGFRISDLTSEFARFNGMRVMVIGDLIVDEYVNCEPLGMSQEDPSIVVTPIEQKRFVGGAGIVAAHANGLGGEVRYFTVTGNDEISAFARETLEGYGVKCTMIADDSRPTTLKQRFRASGKTLLRVSHLRQRDAGTEIAARLLSAIERSIGDTDLLIFADYNYGCVPQALADAVIRMGQQRGLVMVADSQSSSQMSDVSRFTGMKLLTPTEREARMAMRDTESGLVILAEALQRKANAENVVLTLGSEGVLVYAHGASDWITDRLPAFNTSPKDPAGAGDSLLACASMALCAGLDIWKSAYLGSLAAAYQVSRVGNSPLVQRDLVSEIEYA